MIIYKVELDLAEMTSQEALRITEQLVEARSTLVTWQEKGDAGLPCATFVCPNQAAANELIDAFYGPEDATRDCNETFITEVRL